MNMGNRSFKLKCENLAAISGRIRLRYRGICHITSHYNQLMEDIYDVYCEICKDKFYYRDDFSRI